MEPSAVEAYLERMTEALANADAELTLTLGGFYEETHARVWQGQVLVDWERDDEAGGCLLRPALVRRLLALHATTQVEPDEVRVRAPATVVVALSPEHAQLAERLGRSPEMRLSLRFDPADGGYVGGEERYEVPARGKQAVVLLRLTARVHRRDARPASEGTPREQS